MAYDYNCFVGAVHIFSGGWYFCRAILDNDKQEW